MQPRRSYARRIGLFAILSTLSAAASTPAVAIAHLPNVQITAAKVDSSGNIYLAGQTGNVAYIGKLSSDGATTFYAVTLGGSGGISGAGNTTATALDIDSSGAAYVSGTTTASNFPVTAGAVQSAGATAYAAKLDPKGNIVYAALIGGSANTVPRSVKVNSKGELIVSGQITAAVPALFLLKLSADGSQAVTSPQTTGPQAIGGLVTTDSQDNIYIAGVPPGSGTDPESTPGAFQAVPGFNFCGCPFLGYACGGDQFVASLSADLTQTRFLTYVTAKYGASPAYISVDSQGNVLIAGTTAAPGYPTTPASYQPNYTAATGIELTCGPPIDLEYTSPSGYVTLVKADGSGLIFSTFFSGSKHDSVTFAASTSAGIYLAGQAGSSDLPGFDGGVPPQCNPAAYVARMAADGSAISPTRTPPGTPIAYDATTATLLMVSGNDLLRFNPLNDTPIACILDAADLSPVPNVAPGELLAMYGRFLYFVTNPFANSVSPVNGAFPTAFQGLGIMANQTRAPLLYVSQQQINFQAPYEIAGSPQTNLNLTYSDANGDSVSDSRTLTTTASNPVAFITPSSVINQTFPLVINADGTANSQTNPAVAGSMVSIFIDGLGVTTPAPVTGLVNANPSAPLSMPLTIVPYCNGTFCFPAPTIGSAAPAPGSISGVTQVQLRAPASLTPGYVFQVIFSLSAGAVPVRDLNLSFWVE